MTHGELITHDSSLVNTMTAGTGKFACING